MVASAERYGTVVASTQSYRMPPPHGFPLALCPSDPQQYGAGGPSGWCAVQEGGKARIARGVRGAGAALTVILLVQLGGLAVGRH